MIYDHNIFVHDVDGHRFGEEYNDSPRRSWFWIEIIDFGVFQAVKFSVVDISN